jgi:hypothetical protein
MYEGSRISAKSSYEVTGDFNVGVSVHQGL